MEDFLDLMPFARLHGAAAPFFSGTGQLTRTVSRDSRLDRIVAIKTSKDQFSERFEREARSIAALNHPHICTLYDVGPDYLVMKCVDGARLKGPMPLDQAIKYAGQICEALDAAHKVLSGSKAVMAFAAAPVEEPRSFS